MEDLGFRQFRDRLPGFISLSITLDILESLNPNFSIHKMQLVMSLTCHIVNAQLKKKLILCVFFCMYVILPTLILAHVCGCVGFPHALPFPALHFVVASRRLGGAEGSTPDHSGSLGG